VCHIDHNGHKVTLEVTDITFVWKSLVAGRRRRRDREAFELMEGEFNHSLETARALPDRYRHTYETSTELAEAGAILSPRDWEPHCYEPRCGAVMASL
jgi:hypothetical protein